jgi:tetratricopeptide (TPR) repeat protein
MPRWNTACRLLVATLPAALAASPPPALPPEGEPWIRVETAHFTLLSNAPEATVRAAGSHLERLRDVLTQLAPGADFDSHLPTFVYVFKDEASYRPYRPHVRGRPAPFVGYLVRHDFGTYAAAIGDPEGDPTRYLYKQYIHFLLRQHLPALPLWFRQGVAEFYGSFEADEREARIGLPVRDHIGWLREPFATLIPLPELFALTEEPGTGDVHQAMFFTQSWALVHYLLVGEPERRAQTVELARRLIRGEPAAEAIRLTLDMDLPTLEQALAAYVKRDSFHYLRMSVAVQTDLSTRASPLPRPEALVALADLLLFAHPGRAAEAEAHFRAALALAPEVGPAWRGLGYLAEQAGRHPEAVAAYEKAAAAGPGDFVVQYLYGTSLLRSLPGRAQSPEEVARLATAKAALRRSVELNAEFLEAWAQLGLAYSLDLTPSPEGVGVLETAAAKLPQRTDVALNLLLAYARTGDRPAAQALFKRLQASEADAAAVARARELMLQMDFRQAAGLMSEQKVAEAQAILARIQAQTTDPTMRQRAGEEIARLSEATQKRRFAELYNEAVRLWNVGRRDAAIAKVGELAALAEPGQQTEVVAALRRKLGSGQAELPPAR